MYNAGRLEKDEERWRGKSKRQYAKSGKSADKKKQEENGIKQCGQAEGRQG